MFAFVPKQDARGFIMPTFIMDNSKLCLGAKMLYGVLTDYARDRDFCYPSKSTLAKRLQCSLNSVKSYLAQLIKLGFLIVKQVANRSEVFHLLCPNLLVPKCQNLTSRVSNSDTESNGFNANNIPPTPEKLFRTKNSNPPQAHKRQRVGDFSNINKTFEDFWNVYPKKEAKESARSVWHRFFRQGKLPSLDVLKKAVDFFFESSSWQRDNGRYVPYLANFIRGLRWQDVPNAVPKESLEPRKATPSIPLKIESPKEEGERIQRIQQEMDNHTAMVESAYKNIAPFFKTPTKIDDCIAYGLLSSLIKQGISPRVNEQQTVDILEFLKSYRVSI